MEQQLSFYRVLSRPSSQLFHILDFFFFSSEKETGQNKNIF